MRIAICGFSIESCTFSPLISRAVDFQMLRGDELLTAYPFLAQFEEATFIPLLRARALPGGPVDPDFYTNIKDELLNGLKDHGPWDGVFLHLHGAVYVNGMEDTEGDLIAAIREVVGDDCLLSASYDLHGNISKRVFTNLDLLSAYRTAPHIDWYETLERACTLLVECIQQKIRPNKAFIPVPILLPGEQTSTEWEPAASLYKMIPKVIAETGILDASILIGYVWADEPRSTASVLAYGIDESAVQRAALELAQSFWEARYLFKFGVPSGSVDECLQLALAAPEKPIVISDSGDNPTAGGAGDVPYMLERLLAWDIPDAVYASLPDPAAIVSCEKIGVGRDIEISVGGKLDPIHGSPLKISGRILSIKMLPWTLSLSDADPVNNKIAVLQVQGVKVILTQRRTPFHHISDFTQLDINPRQHKIIGVKIGYLVPELAALAEKTYLALSPGAVDQNICKRTYEHIQRPMFPFDPDMEWEPAIR